VLPHYNIGVSRICPDCHTSLEPRAFQELMLDACPKCAGIFFDDGEVAQLKAKGRSAFEALEAAVAPTVTLEQSMDRMRICPQCNTGMDKFRYLYNSNLMLDECGQCGGIWVQEGELSRMADLLDGCRTGKGIGRPAALVTTAAPDQASAPTRLRRVHHFLAGIGS
jgi:Zn-finger nucleic acid-binding protein